MHKTSWEKWSLKDQKWTGKEVIWVGVRRKENSLFLIIFEQKRIPFFPKSRKSNWLKKATLCHHLATWKLICSNLNLISVHTVDNYDLIDKGNSNLGMLCQRQTYVNQHQLAKLDKLVKLDLCLFDYRSGVKWFKSLQCHGHHCWWSSCDVWMEFVPASSGYKAYSEHYW